MTDLQHDLIKRLYKPDHYLAPRPNFSGRKGYMLYYGNQNPEKWYPEKTVRKSVYDYLKKDRRGRLTLNLNLVRQLNGNTVLKKIYHKKTKNHGIRTNSPEEAIQI